MASPHIAFLASPVPAAQEALEVLTGLHGQCPPYAADVIVALGGDGFMLQTLHETMGLGLPVYGMNRGTVGFLMNEYSESDLQERLSDAEEEVINPLSMIAEDRAGEIHRQLAINEVSLLRAGPQAAKLRIYIDARLRMQELVCDGALLATPWASEDRTARNSGSAISRRESPISAGTARNSAVFGLALRRAMLPCFRVMRATAA